MVSLVEGTYLPPLRDSQVLLQLFKMLFVSLLDTPDQNLNSSFCIYLPPYSIIKSPTPFFQFSPWNHFIPLVSSLLLLTKCPFLLTSFPQLLQIIYVLPKFLDYCRRVVGETVRVKGPKSLLENCLPEMSESLHPWGLIIIATWTRPEQWENQWAC